MSIQKLLINYIRANFSTEENAIYFTRNDMLKFAKKYHTEQLKLINMNEQVLKVIEYKRFLIKELVKDRSRCKTLNAVGCINDLIAKETALIKDFEQCL